MPVIIPISSKQELYRSAPGKDVCHAMALAVFKNRTGTEKSPHQTLVVWALRDAMDSVGAASSL
jgi:hypothetical protein